MVLSAASTDFAVSSDRTLTTRSDRGDKRQSYPRASAGRTASGDAPLSPPCKAALLRGFFLIHDLGASVAVDGNAPWLHRLRYLANKVDLEQPILERGAGHLDMVGELEDPLKGTAQMPR